MTRTQENEVLHLVEAVVRDNPDGLVASSNASIANEVRGGQIVYQKALQHTCFYNDDIVVFGANRQVWGKTLQGAGDSKSLYSFSEELEQVQGLVGNTDVDNYEAHGIEGLPELNTGELTSILVLYQGNHLTRKRQMVYKISPVTVFKAFMT